jgi:hypothetical protein
MELPRMASPFWLQLMRGAVGFSVRECGATTPREGAGEKYQPRLAG